MSTKTKFFKQCDIRSRNDGIWTKNNESPLESFSLTHFQSKGCTNLCESIPAQNKTSTEAKIFEKNAISEAETIEFSLKVTNLLGSHPR